VEEIERLEIEFTGLHHSIQKSTCSQNTEKQNELIFMKAIMVYQENLKLHNRLPHHPATHFPFRA
jgi:hypothetical protein